MRTSGHRYSGFAGAAPPAGGGVTFERRSWRSTVEDIRRSTEWLTLISSSAKRHVAPVMLAVKAGVGRIPLDHRAPTERDATLCSLVGQPGGREPINDGYSAPRPTRRAENRILALPT